MQQNKNAENFLNGMQSALKDVMGAFPAANPFDVKTILETQRKNMQAIAEVNNCFMSGWQALAKCQTGMLNQMVQDNTALARESMAEGSPQDKFARQTEILKSSYKRTIENAQELGEIARRNTMEAAELLNRRAAASFTEIKHAADKESK